MRNRTFGLASVLVAMTGLCAGSVMAQPNGPSGDRGPAAAQTVKGKQAKGQRGNRMMMGLFKDVSLTEKQQEQVKQIMAESRKASQAWRKANGEKYSALREKARQAHQSGNQEAMDAVRAEMKSLRESGPSPDQALEKVEQLLDAKQLKQFSENRKNIRENVAQRRQGGERGKGDGPGARERGQRGPRAGGKADDAQQAHARGPKGPKGPKDGEKQIRERLMKGIQLTKEQKTEVHEIFKGGKEAHDAWRKDNRETIESLKQQLREAMRNKDKEAVAEIRKQMKELFKNAPRIDDVFDAVRSVLTPEQQTQFDKNREALKKRHQGPKARGNKGPKSDGDKAKRGGKRKGKGDGQQNRGGQNRPAPGNASSLDI